MNRSLTAVVRPEDDMFVALCPELDIASQGETRDAAIANLREAVELFFDCASDDEVKRRLGGDVYVTQMEVAVG
jgi:predicted RNase H-like HicB family nuclease